MKNGGKAESGEKKEDGQGQGMKGQRTCRDGKDRGKGRDKKEKGRGAKPEKPEKAATFFYIELAISTFIVIHCTILIVSVYSTFSILQ